MKRRLSILLCVAMILSSFTAAFAATVENKIAGITVVGAYTDALAMISNNLVMSLKEL